MNEQLYYIGQNAVSELKWRFMDLTRRFRTRVEMTISEDSTGVFLCTNNEATEHKPSVIIASQRVENSHRLLFFVPTGTYWIYKSVHEYASVLDAHRAFYADPTSFLLVMNERESSRNG